MLPYMCGWDVIRNKLSDTCSDVLTSCSMSLLYGDDQPFGGGITDSYTFWKLYECGYSPDDNCIFAVTNDVLVRIRFFLVFDLDAHAIVDLVSNSSWVDICKSISSKFSKLNIDCIEGVSIMNGPQPIEVAKDQKSFWDLVWHQHCVNSTLNMIVHACRAYLFLCELKISPDVSCEVKIAETTSWRKAVSEIKSALHLTAFQNIIMIEVVDGDGDSIGGPCDNVSDLWRRFSKGMEVDQQTRVLVHCESTADHGLPLSDLAYDARTNEIHRHKFDYRGEFNML